MERLMLKLKLQYFGYLMQRANTLGNILMLEKIEGRRSGQQRMRWLDGIIDSISSVQFSHSVVSDSVTPGTVPPCPSLSPRVYPSSCSLSQWWNLLILCCLFLLLTSIFPSIRVFSNKSALCIRWPKYWNFSFNISPSNEYSGLTDFL